MAAFDPQIWAEVPFAFWAGVFFVFGSIVGSFLNVCIHRLPLGESIVSPPSHCPACRYEIPWYLNIPLVTWLWLRGRCAQCQAPISARYFLVELMTALCFLGCWLRFGQMSLWLVLSLCLLLSGFIVASFIDLEHMIIPDPITLGGVGAGFVCSYLAPALHQTDNPLSAVRHSIAGLVFGWILLYAILRLSKVLFGRQQFQFPMASTIVFGETGIALPNQTLAYDEIFYRKSDAIQLQAQQVRLDRFGLRFQAKPRKGQAQFRVRSRRLNHREFNNVLVRLTPKSLEIGTEQFDPSEITRLEVRTDRISIPREAMGLGDVKFMAAIGAFLGWKGVLFTLTVSSFIGAFTGIVMIGLNSLLRRDYSTRLPYGPYLALAATLWVFAGREILQVMIPEY